jgi:hypothetical protein
VESVEQWRPSALHPLYEVSDHGRVRRVWTHFTTPLKPYEGRSGYPKVQLGYRGPRVYVHTLVALTWIGPRPTNHHVDHIDFDRTNNAVTNLRYLPALVNSVRWADRVDGRNVWVLTADEPAPEGYQPMTESEQVIVLEELAASGW